MLIGKRLREMREARKLSQGDIENRTGLIRCTFRASRMVIPPQQWKRSKSSLGLWKSRCTPSSMTKKNRICQVESPPKRVVFFGLSCSVPPGSFFLCP